MTVTPTAPGSIIVETALWHNGRLLSHIYQNALGGYGEDRYLIAVKDQHPALPWQVILKWDGEPVSGWWAFRAWISDANNSYVTPPSGIPGLLFRYPWAVYSQTILPSLHPAYDGLFTLGLRIPGAIKPKEMTDVDV